VYITAHLLATFIKIVHCKVLPSYVGTEALN